MQQIAVALINIDQLCELRNLVVVTLCDVGFNAEVPEERSHSPKCHRVPTTRGVRSRRPDM